MSSETGRTTSGYTITQTELVAMAKERFGDDPKTYAFQCPNCQDIASIGDFIEAGADPSAAGQECIGRSLNALKGAPTNDSGKSKGRGCDWSAYGLFGGPWRIVLPGAPEPGREAGPEPDTHIAYSFPLAPAPEPKRATSADMTISPYGRAACPSCGRDISLTKKDVVRVHGREKDLGKRFTNCPGSGKAPAASGAPEGKQP